MDEVLIAQLAVLPPHRWPKAIARYRTIAEYDAMPGGTARDVEEVAKRLEVSIGGFYRLLRAFREAQDGQPPNPSRHGLSRHIGDEAERIIQTAILQAGPRAKLIDVQRELRRICGEADLPVPSERSIRTRLGDKPATSRLRARIGNGHALLLDSCALRIGLTKSGAGMDIAHLLAVFEIDSGRTLAHRIVAGAPMQDDVGNLLDQLTGDRPPVPGLPMRATRYLGQLFRQTGSGPGACDRFAVIDPYYVGRTALGFASVFGSRIGRIELNAFAPGAPKLDYALPLAEVAPVVDFLIARRNAELIAPWESPRRRPKV